MPVDNPAQTNPSTVSTNLIDLYDESARLMTICNACRYCEGHCAVFPAMEQRFTFDSKTIDYLANLCHQCGACYQHCQYADPHEFNVNVPKVFSAVREESYASYAWPKSMAWAFRNANLFTALTTAVATVLFFILGSAGSEGNKLTPPGDFYSVISHAAMVFAFGSVGVLTIFVWIFSIRNFWLALVLPAPWRIPMAAYLGAVQSVLTMKNLDGGHGKGCYEQGEFASQARRVFHQMTMYGFLFCFIATSLGTIYHYALNAPAPYDWLTAPKLFGTVGGLSLLIGSAGLWWSKRKMESANKIDDKGLGNSLIALLFFTSLSGLALPLLKGTELLAPLLYLHLGIVFALFLNFSWGKFVHGLFRFVALIASEHEKGYK